MRYKISKYVRSSEIIVFQTDDIKEVVIEWQRLTDGLDTAIYPGIHYVKELNYCVLDSSCYNTDTNEIIALQTPEYYDTEEFKNS